jgi:uncharacterized membrane protein (Fun14 family)
MRAFTVCLILSLSFAPAFADGLLPAKAPEAIEIKMPDGTKQAGIIKDGVFIPISNTPTAEEKVTPAVEKAGKLLPAGTPVQVVIDKEIDADTVKVGATVEGHLVYPIKQNGEVILPAGTPVKGAVTHRKNNMIAGVAGAIELGNFKVVTPDGTMIPLNGGYQRKGHNRVVGSLVGAYFIGLPLFIKGQDGKIESGAEATMYTVQEWQY